MKRQKNINGWKNDNKDGNNDDRREKKKEGK